MMLKTTAALSNACLLACFFANPSHAASDAIMLAMRLEQGGRLLGAPRLVVQSGTKSAVSVKDAFHLEFTPTDADPLIGLALNIQADEGAGLTLVGSPRLLMQPDQLSSVSWTSPGGKAYKLSITPSRASAPSEAQAH